MDNSARVGTGIIILPHFLMGAVRIIRALLYPEERPITALGTGPNRALCGLGHGTNEPDEGYNENSISRTGTGVVQYRLYLKTEQNTPPAGYRWRSLKKPKIYMDWSTVGTCPGPNRISGPWIWELRLLLQAGVFSYGFTIKIMDTKEHQ